MNTSLDGTVLAELSEALAATVEAVQEGIVGIEGRRRRAASGLAWSADGLVLAAHHGVQRDQDLTLILAGGAQAEARLVGRDPTTDLALLQASGATLRPPPRSNLDGLRVGHLVLSVGRPGIDVQASLGIVSTRGAGWRTPLGGKVDAYIQTDIALYPGFSGGALVDAAGRVIGLNTSGLLRQRSLALPVATLERVVGALLEHGHIRRGFLGISAYPARLPAPLAEQLDQRTGLLVVAVEPEGPAGAGGTLVGDLIVALGEVPVRSLDDLLSLLYDGEVGKAAPLRVVRGGVLQDLQVTLGELP